MRSLASRLADVAFENGAICNIEPAQKQGLDITIHKGDYSLYVWLKKDEQDAFIGRWVANNAARFPKGFRNQPQYTKATICEPSPGLFVTRVAQDLYDLDRQLA
jgi:hypothetical protein